MSAKGIKKAVLFMIIALLPVILPISSLAAEKHSSYIWDTFDTVVTFLAYTDTEDEYNSSLSFASNELTRLHRIFDQYHPYEGVANLYELNEKAALAPYQPEKELFDLLCLVDQWRTLYSDRTNPAMGCVLKLWHNAREEGTSLPEDSELATASLHCNWSDVVLDRENGTVFFKDPQLSLDLGAVAKGYAARLTADALYESCIHSFILNAGGNVIVGDAPLDGRSEWTIGVENTDGQTIKVKLGVTDTSVVTSGDYQRFYTVNGKRYHHLIDPDTLYPGEYMQAVTLVYSDSGLADFLSTSLFLLPYEQSRALADSIPGLEAMWTLADGTVEMTDGFSALTRQ